MELSKIHHVAIIVSDYEAAREFYVEKLGFRVKRENYRPEREFHAVSSLSSPVKTRSSP